jgi:hypothetical protein
MMNFAIWKEVAREALPSRNSEGTHSIFGTLHVKGAAIEASA